MLDASGTEGCLRYFVSTRLLRRGGGDGGVIFPGMDYYCPISNSLVYSLVHFLVMVDENAMGVVGHDSS